MSCKDIFEVDWYVGNSVFFREKFFVKYSKKVSKMIVNIHFNSCDLKGWKLIPYFISPGIEKDVIVGSPILINDNKVEIDLEGNVIEDFGEWNVEFVLIGPNGENIGNTNNQRIKYYVGKNVEGEGLQTVPITETKNTINELLLKLIKLINESDEKNKTLENNIKIADDKINELPLEIKKLANELAKIDPNILKITDELAKIDPNILKITDELKKVPLAIKDITDELKKVPLSIKDITVEGNKQVSRIQKEGQVYSDGIAENKKQIQNCFEKPHPSLTYALFVENGILKEWSEDGKSKLETLNQVGNGDLDTRSLSNKGLNGVIGEDNLHIGKGYKNVANVNAIKVGTGLTFSESNNRFTITSTIDTISLKTFLPFSDNWKPNTNYLIKWKVIEGEEYFSRVFFNSKSFNANEGYALALTGDSPRGDFSYVYAKNIIPNGEKLVIDVMVIEGAVIELPYIKDSVLDGRCVLDVPWTSETHSFIGVGFKKTGTPGGSYFPFIQYNGSSAGDGLIFSNLDNNVEFDFFSAGAVAKGFQAGVEKIASFFSKGTSYNSFDLSYLNGDRKTTYLSTLLIYKNIINEDECVSEIEKIKAKKIKLDPMGFVENIPNSKKRMDESGVLKTHLTITSSEKDEDIYPANEGNMYEVIDSSGASYVTVGADGNITAGSKIKNVAGYVRTDETNAIYPLKLRRV